MKARIFLTGLLLVLVATLTAPTQLRGQAQDMKQKFMQAQKANTAALHQHTWKSRTQLNLKGETKKVKVEQVVFDANGQQQKTLLEESPQGEQQADGGRLKKKIVAKKKEEFAGLMQDLVKLVTSYAHIPPEQMQAFIKNAQFSLGQGDFAGTINIAGPNAVQPGDAMRLWIDKQTLMMRRVEIDTALEKNPVHVVADYQSLSNSLTYQAKAALEYPEKEIQVFIENYDYQPLAPPAGAAPQAQPGMQATARQPSSQGQPAPPQGQAPPLDEQTVDKLLAPIALYPDALIGQILMCSTSPFQVRELNEWLIKNQQLKGSALQETAQKEGFDPSFVAIAVFPQVVNMMASQMDWTQQVGRAFSSNRKAVFDSIQRLRAQAQQAGNLQSTPQQEVLTQTTQSGQQVIVIQPANPQVVYVPQYNPQVVYTQPPPQPTQTTVVVKEESSSSAGAAAVIGFTAGVIIGAAASDNYYYGPYGWHGAALYNEAWEDYYDHRQDMAQDYYEHREEMAGERTERQDTRQQEQTERQGSRQEQQTERQTGRDENQTERQTGRQESSSQRQTSRQESASTRQSGASATSSGTGSRGYSGSRSQASTQQTGTRSGAFSGYQSGSSERAASARGRSSSSSSRSSGGRSRKRS